MARWFPALFCGLTLLFAGCNKEDPSGKAGDPPNRTAFPVPLKSGEANGPVARTIPRKDRKDEAKGPVAGTIPSKNRPGQTILHWVETATIEGGDGHTDRIESLCFSPDGQTLATGSIDSSLKLWEVSTGKLRKSVAREHKPAALAFSPDGKTLAVGSLGEMTVTLLDPVTGKPKGQFTDPDGYGQPLFKGVRSVAYTADGARFAAGGDDNRVRIWDTTTGKMVHNFEAGWYFVHSVAFTRAGRTLAAGGSNGQLHLLDLATGRHQALVKQEKAINCVAFSPNGKLLAYGDENNSARVWDLANKVGNAVYNVGRFFARGGPAWSQQTRNRSSNEPSGFIPSNCRQCWSPNTSISSSPLSRNPASISWGIRSTTW